MFQYYDAQTDDAALTKAVMQSAQQLGAQLKIPATFTRAAQPGDVAPRMYPPLVM